MLVKASSCDGVGTWHLGNTLNTGVEERQYDYYHPDVASPSALIIFLHGAGDNGRTPAAYSMWPIVPEADTHGFLAVMPVASQSLGWSWNDGEDCSDSGNPYPTCAAGYPNDVDFIDKLIVHMKQQYAIPIGKVYVMGFSNGGGLASMLSCLSTQIDAIAVQGGYVPSEAAWAKYCPQKSGSTKYWAGLGSNDGLMNLNQGKVGLQFAVEVLNGCSDATRQVVLNNVNGVTCYEYHGSSNANCAKSRYCEYNGQGHVWPSNAVNAALEFFSASSYPAVITPSLYGTPNQCQSGGGGNEEDDEDEEDDDDEEEDDDDEEDCLAVKPTTKNNDWCARKCNIQDKARCKRSCSRKCNAECLCNELCVDSDEWSISNRQNKNCKWVAKKPGKRCK